MQNMIYRMVLSITSVLGFFMIFENPIFASEGSGSSGTTQKPYIRVETRDTKKELQVCNGINAASPKTRFDEITNKNAVSMVRADKKFVIGGGSDTGCIFSVDGSQFALKDHFIIDPGAWFRAKKPRCTENATQTGYDYHQDFEVDRSGATVATAHLKCTIKDNLSAMKAGVKNVTDNLPLDLSIWDAAFAAPRSVNDIHVQNVDKSRGVSSVPDSK